MNVSTFLTLLFVPDLYNWFTTEMSFKEEELVNQADLIKA